MQGNRPALLAESFPQRTQRSTKAAERSLFVSLFCVLRYKAKNQHIFFDALNKKRYLCALVLIESGQR